MSAQVIDWIASRTYRMVARTPGHEPTTLFVGISRPFRLSDAEIAQRPNSLGCACLIQTGAPATRRTVVSRDELEALFLGILAIDLFLEQMSRKFDLVTEDGRPFSIESDGLLHGTVGVQFAKLRESQKMQET